ncbi:MAG: hypothetical protein ACRDUA_11175, partial [Micromonosporaceae bacterium]
MACLVVLAVVATLTAALLGRSGVTARFDGSDRSAERLTSAAVNLLGNPGARYRGWFTDPDGDRVTVDATVTNEGSTLATLTIDGEEVALATTGERAFVRASEEFWRAHGAPRDSLAQYGRQWVKVAKDFLGIDLSALLAPGVLARTLGAQAERGRTSPGRVVKLHGAEVLEMTTPDMRVYVTTTEPRRIVRVAARSGTEPTPSPSSRHTTRRTGPPVFVPVQAAGTDYEVDLSDLSDAEVRDLYKKLDKKIRELKSSIDSQVRFGLDGSVTLSPCNTNGCRAKATISNTVESRSPYLKAKQPVHASITVRMTLDGRPVATCRETKTMKPNGSASVSCFAGYYIPPSRNPRTHTVRALVSAVARAVVTADIKAMVKDLAEEQDRNPPDPSPSPTPGGTPSPGDSSPSPSPSDENEC